MTTARLILLTAFTATACLFSTCHAYTPPVVPPISPATNLPNQIYKWRDSQQVRYQVDGPEDGKPVVLIHGLFVNSDHWRHTLPGLAKEGYRTYALDLWGCGYSACPPRDSNQAQAMNGENGRFETKEDAVLKDIELGSASGTQTRVRNVELKHPLGSPYNFYTWSELITDFCENIVLPNNKNDNNQVTLVCNSIGTMSSLQAVLDHPDLYNGVFCIAPNFRELHSAEVALPQVSMPILRFIQKQLRENGQGLFDALAKPSTVKEILKEPYAVTEAVDDVLVEVLLNPLLNEGASKVVFDTLSYSAGPLPEQQLAIFPHDKPVWVGYGKDDPWTPPGRVEALVSKPTVEKVVAWDGVGHCPHDEAPSQVNPVLLDFLKRVGEGNKSHSEKEKSVASS